MRSFKYFLLLLSITLVHACKKENLDQEPGEFDSEYEQIHMFEANGHEIQIYGDLKTFKTGYNNIYVRFIDANTGEALHPEQLSLIPIMHMMSKQHSCPHSLMYANPNSDFYQGFTVFQMPSNSNEYWELKFEYNMDGVAHSASDQITVMTEALNHRSCNVFLGSDSIKYILALKPFDPEVSINDISAVLYTMESMMDFKPVENFEISIDPRMPGMGNHSSPNNEDLSYNSNSEQYEGKLSLTMTGYWKISLKLLNDSGMLIKGEDIAGNVTSSSIYFELEF